MLLKIVFLFFTSAVLAFHLQDTPEDLKDFFQEVDTRVKSLQHETAIQISSNVAPLSMFVSDAKTGVIMNMYEAAKPYWATIKSLQETAEAQGQDISECVDLGNNQLYVLNTTIVNTANSKFNYYKKSGDDILTSSSTEAYSVIRELIVLGEVVNLCNDDTCATDLKKIVTQYYDRAKSTLIDAETKARNYVFVYLPVLLAQYEFKTDLYVANYTVFLDDVKSCVSNL